MSANICLGYLITPKNQSMARSLELLIIFSSANIFNGRNGIRRKKGIFDKKIVPIKSIFCSLNGCKYAELEFYHDWSKVWRHSSTNCGRGQTIISLLLLWEQIHLKREFFHEMVKMCIWKWPIRVIGRGGKSTRIKSTIWLETDIVSDSSWLQKL